MTTDDINPAEAVAFCEVLMAAFDTLIAEFRTAASGTLRRMYEAEVVADKIEAQRAIALMVPLHVPDAPAELRTARARVAALESGAEKAAGVLKYIQDTLELGESINGLDQTDAYNVAVWLAAAALGSERAAGELRKMERHTSLRWPLLTAAAPTAAADTGAEARQQERGE